MVIILQYSDLNYKKNGYPIVNILARPHFGVY